MLYLNLSGGTEGMLKRLPWLAVFGLMLTHGLVAGAEDTNSITGEAAQHETNLLTMNFRGAPLNLVLDYLSDAAGFIINKEADVKGTVEVWSKQPVTKDEAVELLSSVLRKNGYGMTRNGRILTIVAMDSVK